MLESAGRPDAQASNDLDGAVGLTQILAETGQNLLGMRIDVRRSERLTRGIQRGRKVAARLRERRRVDERFDPAKAIAATARYLQIAKQRLGRDDLAVAELPHGHRQHAERARRLRPGATSPTRSSSSTPRRCATRGRGASSRGSATTPRPTSGGSWRPRRSCACYREDPPASRAGPSSRAARRRPRRCCTRPTAPRRSATRSRSAAPARPGELAGLDARAPRPRRRADRPARWASSPGGCTSRRALYRALRPQALRMLEVIGAGTKRDRAHRPARRDEHGARHALPARARRAQHRGDAQLLACTRPAGRFDISRDLPLAAPRRSRSSSCSTA